MIEGIQRSFIVRAICANWNTRANFSGVRDPDVPAKVHGRRATDFPLRTRANADFASALLRARPTSDATALFRLPWPPIVKLRRNAEHFPSGQAGSAESDGQFDTGEDRNTK